MEDQLQDEDAATAEPMAQSEAVNLPPLSTITPDEGKVSAAERAGTDAAVEPGDSIGLRRNIEELQNDQLREPQAVNPPPAPPERGADSGGNAKVFEKIVEQVVEKPVEVIKEVIKEVPVERIVEIEKVVEKPVERIVERVVEKPVEVVKEVRVFDEEKAAEATTQRLMSSRAAALHARQQRRDVKLEKIIALVQKRGRVTNDEVQILIGAANRSAVRYLALLVRQGRLHKTGRGRGAYYHI